jgi:hypothetical protein
VAGEEARVAVPYGIPARDQPALPDDPPHPLRQPTRWPALFGLAALLLGQVVRWGWFAYPNGEVRAIGQASQSTDGFIATLLGLALVAVASSRIAENSGFRTVQYLPAILGGACLLEGLLGYRGAAIEVNAWRDHGPAGYDIGVGLAVGGSVLAAVGGVATTAALIRHPVHSDVVGVGRHKALALDIVVGAIGGAIGLAVWPLLIGMGSMGAIFPTAVSTLLGPAVALSLWHRIRGRAGPS